MARTPASPAPIWPLRLMPTPPQTTPARSMTQLSTPSPRTARVVFNGVALDAATLEQFAQVYGAIPSGDYWYDPFSGLVGAAGGPSSGQILPNLPLGGPLKANASGGGQGVLTGVFINGREIHPSEMMTLAALFGAVNPGRYWLGPNLVGGYEGGPPMFDLRAAAAQSSAGGGGGAGGEPGYNRSTPFGDLMSDGRCSGYFDPASGASVMTGNC
jgi:hypothetical protein